VINLYGYLTCVYGDAINKVLTEKGVKINGKKIKLIQEAKRIDVEDGDKIFIDKDNILSVKKLTLLDVYSAVKPDKLTKKMVNELNKLRQQVFKTKFMLVKHEDKLRLKSFDGEILKCGKYINCFTNNFYVNPNLFDFNNEEKILEILNEVV